MALIRRTVAAAVAALTLAGAAAQPAQAYWRSTGRGTGTVPTVTGVANLLTLVLTSNSKNGKVVISGNAGPGTGYGKTVTVVLCSVNSWPCPSGSTLATPPDFTVSNGTYGTGNSNPITGLSGRTVFGLATQTETSGWTDKAFAGPVNP